MGELLAYVRRLQKLFLILAKKCCNDRLVELASETGGQASIKAKHLSPMSFPLDFHVICHQKMSSTCRMDLPTSHDPLERIPLGEALQLAFSVGSRATRLVHRDYHRSQASHDVEVSDYQSAHQGPSLRRKSNYHLTEIGTGPKGAQTGHPLHFSQPTDVCANKMVACLQH